MTNIGSDQLDILKPLGEDQAIFVARNSSVDPPRLAIVERVTRASPVPAARAQLLRRGKALQALEHPKVVRVRAVFERDGEVVVASDYVDGEWLSLVTQMTPPPPVSIMLRFVLDVLEGLAALHDLRSEKDESLAFAHGAVGPETILLSSTGMAMIARAYRLPRPGTNPKYVPPELRRGDGQAEVRSDVYAVGAILRDVLASAPSDAAWAEPLMEIAQRACSVDAENRYPSAAAMATAIRCIVGSRLATVSTAADFMKRAFGDSMAARRKNIEAGGKGTTVPSESPISVKTAEFELADSSTSVIVDADSSDTLLESDRSPPVKKPALELAMEPAEPPPPPPQPKKPPPRAGAPGSLAPVPRRPLGDTAPLASLPPPTIQPDDPTTEPLPVVAVAADTHSSEQYRRRLPTFPVMDHPRGGMGLGLGLAAALGMVLTFGLGWWVGRAYAPPPRVVQLDCPAPPQVMAQAIPSPGVGMPPPVSGAGSGAVSGSPNTSEGPTGSPLISSAGTSSSTTGAGAASVSASPAASHGGGEGPASHAQPVSPAHPVTSPQQGGPVAKPPPAPAVSAPTPASKPPAPKPGYVPDEL